MRKSDPCVASLILALTLALVFVLIIGCSKDSSTGPGGGGNTGGVVDSFQVGLNADTLVTSDGNITLILPAGSLSSPQTITIMAINEPQSFVDSTCYQFGPDSFNFIYDIKLIIHYDESKLPPGSSEAGLGICRIVGSEWEVMSATLDPYANTLEATLSSFSSYGARVMATGQVYQGGKNLYSQADVNAFGAQYVGTSSYLKISGMYEQFWDLTPLSNITWVGGDLSIGLLDSLTSLNGLQGITVVGHDLNIGGMDNLISLGGLGGIASVGRYLDLDNNPKLTEWGGFGPGYIGGSVIIEECESVKNLDFLTGRGQLYGLAVFDCPGLSSLAGLGQLTLAGAIQFENCDSLSDLTGLGSLYETGTLSLKRNDRLLSLDGLNNLRVITWGLELHMNPLLQDITGLSHVYHVGNLDIEDNDDLTTLDGLNNVTQLGWLGGGWKFSISYNAHLIDITPLSGLQLNPATNFAIPCDAILYWNQYLEIDNVLDWLDAIGGPTVLDGYVIFWGDTLFGP